MAQVDIPTSSITGQFDAQIVEVGPNAVTPTNVIRTDTLFRVDCTWFIDGALAPALDGTWHIQVVLEGLGSAVEVSRPPEPVALSTAPPLPTPRNYAHSVSFPPGSISLGGEESIMAEVGVALTYRFPPALGGTPGPIAAFVPLGVVQIYQPS